MSLLTEFWIWYDALLETFHSYGVLTACWSNDYKHFTPHGVCWRWQKFSFLQQFFALSSDKLVRLDQSLRRKRTLKQQVDWLHRKFPHHLCLIQIGCYYEAFDANAKILATGCGLRLTEQWRGFKCGCGFSQRLLPQIMSAPKKHRQPVVIVRETGRELYRTKERLPDLIIEFPENNEAWGKEKSKT